MTCSDIDTLCNRPPRLWTGSETLAALRHLDECKSCWDKCVGAFMKATPKEQVLVSMIAGQLDRELAKVAMDPEARS